MPQKKITIPEPIHFTDPTTGAPIESPDGTLDFTTFMAKLNSNPLWSETWQAGMAQRSINQAMKTANGHLTVSEEDWKFLEQAAKQPRTMIFGMGGQSGVIPGLGFHPSLSGQIVPFQLAIINAETV